MADKQGEYSSARYRRGDRRNGASVVLNIYDLVKLNQYVSKFGVGVYHSGVEVYSREYAYGSHTHPHTGVYHTVPRQMDHLRQEEVKFRESVVIGWTELSEGAVKELVRKMEDRYPGNGYHLLNRNCNHFTNELCQLLCGSDIPPWVNRLAYLSSWVPYLSQCLPPGWLQSSAILEGGESMEDTEQ